MPSFNEPKVNKYTDKYMTIIILDKVCMRYIQHDMDKVMEIYDISIYRILQSHTINLVSNYIVTSLPHLNKVHINSHNTYIVFYR